MYAIAGQLIDWDVGSDIAGPSGLAEQLTDQLQQMTLPLVMVVATVPSVGKSVRTVLATISADLGIGVEHCPQPAVRWAGFAADRRQLGQVLTDPLIVPGREHLFDVAEVLVERGAGDATGLGELGHGHAEETSIPHKTVRRGQDRLANYLPVGGHGLGPQPGHTGTVQSDRYRYTMP